MSVINLRVNGQSHTVDVDPATPLLFVLSNDLALNGPKFGRGLAQCGSCTVLANGRAIRGQRRARGRIRRTSTTAAWRWRPPPRATR